MSGKTNVEDLNQQFSELFLLSETDLRDGTKRDSVISKLNALVKRGARVDAIQKNGETLLTTCARDIDTFRVRLLIETFYADPLVRNRSGKTPLDIADEFDCLDTFNFLNTAEHDQIRLDNKFRAAVLSHDFHSARMYAEQNASMNSDHNDARKTVFQEAVETSNYKAIIALIGIFHIPNTSDSHGNSPWDYVMGAKDKKIVYYVERCVWRADHPFLRRFFKKPDEIERLDFSEKPAQAVPPLVLAFDANAVGAQAHEPTSGLPVDVVDPNAVTPLPQPLPQRPQRQIGSILTIRGLAILTAILSFTAATLFLTSDSRESSVEQSGLQIRQKAQPVRQQRREPELTPIPKSEEAKPEPVPVIPQPPIEETKPIPVQPPAEEPKKEAKPIVPRPVLPVDQTGYKEVSKKLGDGLKPAKPAMRCTSSGICVRSR